MRGVNWVVLVSRHRASRATQWVCLGSGVQSPASPLGGPGSIPDPVTLRRCFLWIFLCSPSFHQWPRPAWSWYCSYEKDKQAKAGNLGALDRKVLSLLKDVRIGGKGLSAASLQPAYKWHTKCVVCDWDTRIYLSPTSSCGRGVGERYGMCWERLVSTFQDFFYAFFDRACKLKLHWGNAT